MNQNPQKDSSRIFLSAREIIGAPGPTGDEIGYLEIDWHDIADLSGLDEPQTMNLKTWIGLGYRDGTVPMIGTSGYGHYDKQPPIFSIDPGETWRPSGADLPSGEPGASDVHMLGPASSNEPAWEIVRQLVHADYNRYDPLTVADG